jgi:hypothetical protein
MVDARIVQTEGALRIRQHLDVCLVSGRVDYAADMHNLAHFKLAHVLGAYGGIQYGRHIVYYF